MDQGLEVAMDVRVDVQLATPGTRGLALLIDLGLLYAVQMLLWVVGIAVLAVLGAWAGLDGAGWIIAALTLGIALLTGFAFIAFEVAWDGQTPGKRWVGIRVVQEDGSRASAGAVVVRNVLRLVDFLPGGFVVGLLAMALSPRNQRVGDMVAGTLVVVAERPLRALRRWPTGLSDADIRLLEAWFERAPTLPLERREALALQLVTRLGWELEGQTAAAALHRRCPTGP